MDRRRRARKQATNQSSSNSTSGVRREFQLASSVLRVFTKRIVTSSYVNSNGAGLIPVTTLASTNSVTALGDFSAVAGIYSNYRVKAIQVRAKPFYPIPLPSAAAFVSPMIAVLPFRSGLIPSTWPGFIESSETKIFSGYKDMQAATSNKGYPDGKLWHPTNAVISAADSYGIAIMGQNLVSGTVNLNVWCYVVEYLVEFSVEN